MLKTVFIIATFLFSILFTTSCTNQTNANVEQKLPNNKVIIYDIKRKGCPACAYQERVLKVKEVKELLDKYCKIIYVDINEQDKLPQEWMKTNKTPTVHFVDNKMHKLIPSIGSVQPYEFKDAILRAVKELKR